VDSYCVVHDYGNIYSLPKRDHATNLVTNCHGNLSRCAAYIHAVTD
jgi:hypothetical protein